MASAAVILNILNALQQLLEVKVAEADLPQWIGPQLDKRADVLEESFEVTWEVHATMGTAYQVTWEVHEPLAVLVKPTWGVHEAVNAASFFSWEVHEVLTPASDQAWEVHEPLEVTQSIWEVRDSEEEILAILMCA